VDKGKAEKAAIVVNNLQDSQDAGKGIAEELKIPNINLSNFPGGLDNTETWEKAITKNVDILLDAINK
jgi:nitrogenase molybdenum-iron protein alpha/beta subunit